MPPLPRLTFMLRALCLLLLVLPFAASAQGPLPQQFLAAHNQLRARVRVPPLVWSERLAASAQQWADHLIALRQFFHNPGNPHGENLYVITGGRSTPAEVVQSWAVEAPQFNPRTNTCRGTCGHYTQIVWRDTQQLGCAASRTKGREVWVCHYNPPGNFIGRKPY